MFDVTLLILLGLAALGFISHNTTVAVSILVLIIVRVTPLSTFFPWIEKQGLSIGIIILTIGVMAPIASGTLPPSTLIHSFLNWKSLVAIAVGVIVSWLGGRGADAGRLPETLCGMAAVHAAVFLFLGADFRGAFPPQHRAENDATVPRHESGENVAFRSADRALHVAGGCSQYGVRRDVSRLLPDFPAIRNGVFLAL